MMSSLAHIGVLLSRADLLSVMTGIVMTMWFVWEYLIIKKGEHGALLFHENKMFFAPALPLEEVFDPTGAGDTFAGGFMGYIASTDDVSFDNMKRAIINGSALASFCVEEFGTERLKMIGNKDLEERIEEFVALANFNMVQILN